MPNPLSIQAARPAQGSADIAVPPRGSKPSQATSTPPAKPPAVFVNPNFTFDPQVGLVVIEFHDNSGKLMSSIPSQRQLDAYRMHQETPPGQEPSQVAQPAPQLLDGKTPPG
jgi:hypothetical protein